MRAVTRLSIVLALILAVASPAAAQTAAQRGIPPDLKKTLRSANFIVHYTTVGPNRTNPSVARLFSRAAEDGLVRLVRDLGFRRPRPDRDRLVDIYVHDQIGQGVVATAGADDNRAGAPSSGYIEVDSAERDRGTLVHELTHVIQFGYGMGTEGQLFIEGTGTWSSTALYGANTTDAGFGTPISSTLTCQPVSRCPGDGAYGHWRFWQSLTETFGPRFVGEVFQRDGVLVRRSGGDPSLTALRQVLAARGSTLAVALQQYVERSARADWQHPALAPIQSITTREAMPGEEVTRQLSPAASAAVNVNLRPLSGRYVRITEGPDQSDCGPRSLTVTATVPAGSESVPSLLTRVAGVDSPPIAMTAAGNVFTAVVPWQACRADAYVLISNPKVAGNLTIGVAAQATPPV